MTFALAQALLLADAVTPDAMGQALHLSATRGVSLVRALQALGTLEPLRLEQQLEKGDAPTMRHVAPVMQLVDSLPPGLCERLLVLPVRQDSRTGTVDVAVVDARDAHGAEEIGFWLGAPVRLVRTSLASMDAAFRRLDEKPATLGMEALAPPIDTRHSTPPDDGAAPGPNIPIPLTRRPSTTLIELPYAPIEERSAAPAAREPVLDLQRRKVPGAPPSAPGVPPPPSVAPATQRGPFNPSRVARPAAPPFGLSPTPVAVTMTAPSSRPAPPPVPPPPPMPGPASRAPAPKLPPPPAPADVIADLRSARDRDRVVELLLNGTRAVAGRVAVLAVKRDSLTGWACSPEIADAATFRKVTLSTTTPTVLTEVIEQGGAWLARFPHDLAHAPLLEMLRLAPAENVAVAGVRVEGRATLVVIASRLTQLSQAKKVLADFTSEAGEALGRVLRERRK